MGRKKPNMEKREKMDLIGKKKDGSFVVWHLKFISKLTLALKVFKICNLAPISNNS